MTTPERMSPGDIERAVKENLPMSRGDFANRDDLDGLSLAGGIFDRATFAGSNLNGVSFVGANLRGADFTGADCSDSDFDGADLAGAIFRNTDIAGTDLDHVITDAIGLVSVGKDRRDYNFYGVYYDRFGWMTMAGCRFFSIDEAREHWGEESNSSNPDECLEIAERIAAMPAPVYPKLPGSTTEG